MGRPEDPLESCDSAWMERWQAECERAVLNLCRLLRLAGRSRAGSAVLELLRSVPFSPQEALTCPERSYFHRCLVDASLGFAGRDEFPAAVDYFKALMAMPPSRRFLLEASVTGVVLGLGVGY